MPFTVSHTAAVIPLARLNTVWLAPSALVIGSMSPDLELLVTGGRYRYLTHSLEGLVTLDLPFGLAVLVLFQALLKRPLLWLLPKAHRLRIAPYAERFRLSVPVAIGCALSVLIGAWTHLAWDAFTHYTDLSYSLGLTRVMFETQGYRVEIYRFLQGVSHFVGLAGIAWWYVHWYRRQPVPIETTPPGASEAARRQVAFGLLFVPLATAAALNAHWMLRDDVGLLNRFVNFTGNTAIRGMGFLLAGIVLFSTIHLLVGAERRRTERLRPGSDQT